MSNEEIWDSWRGMTGPSYIKGTPTMSIEEKARELVAWWDTRVKLPDSYRAAFTDMIAAALREAEKEAWEEARKAALQVADDMLDGGATAVGIALLQNPYGIGKSTPGTGE